MPLSNLSNLNFASPYRIDKIVRVDEGSFDAATATTVGGFLKRFSIVHGFTRPVFTDLLWSEDNTTWIDGGAGQAASSYNSSISYSDLTSNYILTTKTTGTIYYKLISYWIHDYDTTNPSVASYVSPHSNGLFDSRLNYQKIQEQNSDVVTGTSFNSVFHSSDNVAPNFKVYFEAFPDEVWNLNSGGARNPFLWDITNQAEMTAYITTVNLVVDQTLPAGAAVQERRFWYEIYEDAN